MERAELICEGSVRAPTAVAAMAEAVTMDWRRHGPRHPAVRSRALPTGMEGLDHQVGACRPSCSPECYRAKLRSLGFALPASFRAAR